jgi:SAM-dependent methyltransferase
MSTTNCEDIKRTVRETYGKIAMEGGSGCDCGCGPSSSYSQAERDRIPEGADLGLGSGNPRKIADIQPGETVLDLGSGAGIDCFLSADAVGAGGLVIGIDMTPEMVSRARMNARESGYSNVDFRLGEIENPPVADSSVDVILSNCVINLSPDKASVYGEAFRVLKPGGRVAISDIVITAELPDEARGDLERYAACISGAASIHELKDILAQTGFKDIRTQPGSREVDISHIWKPGSDISDYTVSATIEAVKPAE